MTGSHPSIEKLYAYHDGILSEAERRAVERHLTTCPLCQARHERSVAVVSALKMRFGSERAPQVVRSAIRQRIETRSGRPRTITWPWAGMPARAAVALGALLLLAAMLAVAYPSRETPPLVAQLAEAHRQLSQDPGRVQSQGDVAVVSAWLDGQLGEQIGVPSPEEFRLVGARVETVAGRPAAHLLYEQESAPPMSLLIWRGEPSTVNLTARDLDGGHFYVGAAGAQAVVLWHDHGLTYACVSDDAPDALLDVAARVWRSDVN